MFSTQQAMLGSVCQLDFTLLLEAASLIENVDAHGMEVFDGIFSSPNMTYPTGKFVASFEFQCLLNLLSSLVLFDNIYVPTTGLFFENLDKRYSQLVDPFIARIRDVLSRGGPSEMESFAMESSRRDRELFTTLKRSSQALEPLFKHGCVRKIVLSEDENTRLSNVFSGLVNSEVGDTLAALARDLRAVPWYEQIHSLPHKSFPLYIANCYRYLLKDA
jgi:hypothetical protein